MSKEPTTWPDVALELVGPIGIAIVILSMGGCVAIAGGCEAKFKDDKPSKEASP